MELRPEWNPNCYSQRKYPLEGPIALPEVLTRSARLLNPLFGSRSVFALRSRGDGEYLFSGFGLYSRITGFVSSRFDRAFRPNRVVDEALCR